MWWKIAKLAGLFFLGFGAAQDIKYQKISTEYLLAGSCAAILYRALFGRMHWSVWVAGLGCGIVFLMISKWSQEGIDLYDLINKLPKFEPLVYIILFLLFSVVILGISYLISLTILKKKEF